MKTIDELLKVIKEDKTRDLMMDIYDDASRIDAEIERYQKALEGFRSTFGDTEVEIYSAPGRSEVGGNHTDHQRGKIMACSLNLDFIAVVHKTDSNVIEMQSEGYPMCKVDLAELGIVEAEKDTTAALIRGTAAGIARDGHAVGGFQAYVTSEVLSGSGMSSSAAMEILLGTILSGLYNDMKLDSVYLAKVGQYAENVYFGKPCGLMDQMACSVGGLIYVDFEDTKDPDVRPVKVDFSKYAHSLCIVDTKGSHADLTPEYAAIPTEMKKVAAHYGKEVLREVDVEQFKKDLAVLCKECGDRAVLRSIHFFCENERVVKEMDSLEAGDFKGFLEAVKESGRSSYEYLQNVFCVTKPQEQGLSMGLAVSDMVLGDNGAYRVHGGGFAGTIQAFVPNKMVEAYREALDALFGEGSCHVLKVRKYGGIKVLGQYTGICPNEPIKIVNYSTKN